MTRDTFSHGGGPNAAQPPPIPSGWRVLELNARPDYFALWNAIREDAPIRDNGERVFIVSGWKQVNAVLRNPEFKAGTGVSESFGGSGGPVETVVRNWLMSLSGDTHRRARALVSRLFTPKSVTEMESSIRAMVKSLVASFTEASRSGPVDFVNTIAARVPSEVIRILFNIDEEAWGESVEPLFIGEAAHSADAFAAVQGLAQYFHGMLRQSRGRDIGGLIGQLRAEDKSGGRLTEDEVMANAVLIVTAAVDTTTGLIANTLLSLLENPTELKKVRSHRGLIPAAIEESLRHCPSAPSTTRHAANACELGGVSIPSGSDLFLSIAAANRDPRKFMDPDRFDIERDASALHTFGGGAHFCLGAALARLEAKIVFEELFAAADEFILAEPVCWRTNNPSVRVPQNLTVACQ